jgi:hypothetical protein
MDMHDHADNDAMLFAVVLEEVLVAQDIAWMIGDRWPDARVVQRRSLEEAAAALPAGRLRAVFVQRDALSYANSALYERVVRDGARSVLVTTGSSTGLPPGWRMLMLPFAQDEVERILDEGHAAAGQEGP